LGCVLQDTVTDSMEQPHHESSSFLVPPPPPPPYTMCSEMEWRERIRTKEISAFEKSNATSTDGTCSSFSDPCRAVSKYRRSAASLASSNGSSSRPFPRTLEQLRVTAHYLVQLFLHFDKACGTTTTTTKKVRLRGRGSAVDGKANSTTTTNDEDEAAAAVQPQSQQDVLPFLSLVNFIEDRIRAIQVDVIVTSSQQHCKKLQAVLARCHILLLYILSDNSSKNNKTLAPSQHSNAHARNNTSYYERKFGLSALQTALSAYWVGHNNKNNGSMNDGTRAVPMGTTEDDSDHDNDDNEEEEMLSCTLLVHLSQQLSHDETTCFSSAAAAAFEMTTFWFQMTELYRNLFPGGSNRWVPAAAGHAISPSSDPCLRWTLNLVAHVCRGEWQSILSSLLGATAKASSSSSSPRSSTVPFNRRFRILAQCIMAPNVPYLRWRALQQFNLSLNKGQSVAGCELARLFGWHDPQARQQHWSIASAARSTWSDDDDNSSDRNTAHEERKDAAAFAAIEFCKAYGMPVHDNGNDVLFKMNPIQPFTSVPRTSIRDTMDGTIFVNDRMDDGHNKRSCTMRTSAEGIVLPSAAWMEKVLL
jgi:SAC3/GANP family